MSGGVIKTPNVTNGDYLTPPFVNGSGGVIGFIFGSEETTNIHLVIGSKGEVGSALCELIRIKGKDVYEIDWSIGDHTHQEFDFIHICIPYQEMFVKIVQDYLAIHYSDTTIVIIHSTVRPWTTKMLSETFPRIAYSPVRGVHPQLIEGLTMFQKFFATENVNIIADISCMFNNLEIWSVGLHEDPTTLEFAKLYNTLWYFKEIQFAQELSTIITKHNLSKTLVKFIGSTGDRQILPYAQKIGGHCLVPNAKILLEFSPLAKYLLAKNAQYGLLHNDKKYWFGIKQTV